MRNNNMRFYAIRERGTQKYLPYRFHRKRGGASVDEPVEITEGMMPRPFLTLASARSALSAWAQGVWSDHYSNTQYGPEYDGCEPTKKESRKKENMEIVVVMLNAKK